MWPGILLILPEVIDLAVGMSAKAGTVGEAEVVFQDGGNEARKTWVSGKCCEVEGVLAIAIRVIEADAFRRVAEPIGLFLGVEVDDSDVLVHRPAILLVAADGDVQIFFAFGFAQVGSDEAAFVGEGDALEVIGQGFADDLGDGLVGCCDAVDMVVLVYHSVWSFVGTVPSRSLMISWIR